MRVRLDTYLRSDQTIGLEDESCTRCSKCDVKDLIQNRFVLHLGLAKIFGGACSTAPRRREIT